MSQDEDHLRLLSTFHYIVGGLAALFSFFPLLYAGFGLVMLYASSHPQPQNGPPPAIIGYIFIGLGVFGFLLGETFALCIVLAGRFIAQRRRYWFVFVTACMQCLFFPFGIILGVFTIIVLSRDPVKELFGITSTPAAIRPTV
ncbi:MAG TPA: hypothetical protein VNW72_04825 [Chthoniobacterales bacterium]|jgi:hypothetical protein|nr:hypothetical protein [Chthoniobacterales bacterium]